MPYSIKENMSYCFRGIGQQWVWAMEISFSKREAAMRNIVCSSYRNFRITHDVLSKVTLSSGCYGPGIPAKGRTALVGSVCSLLPLA